MVDDVPRFSWGQVCARRLARHGLSAPLDEARPADVVAATAGTHAQVMSAAELGVGLRTGDLTRVDVRDALWQDRSLVKTYGPRGTVHLLPAADLPAWVGALSAVPVDPNAFTDGVRLTPEQREQVVDAVGRSLDGARLTVDELSEAVVDATGPWAGDLVMPAFQGMWPRWRQAMHLAGMRGALCFAPNRGRRATYTSPRDWLPGFEPMARDAALAHVLRSYLYAYGPATPKRFAHWLNAPERWAVEVFESLAGDLQPVDAAGTPGWVWAGDTDAPAEPPRGVRLLPYFDGYAYRVGNQPPELLYPGAEGDRARRGNFQLLVVDGVVAGLWHQRRSGRRIEVTVEPFVRLTAVRKRALDAQVARVGEVLQGDPRLTVGTVTVGGHA